MSLYFMLACNLIEKIEMRSESGGCVLQILLLTNLLERIINGTNVRH